jgi:hypothetical protein
LGASNRVRGVTRAVFAPKVFTIAVLTRKTALILSPEPKNNYFRPSTAKVVVKLKKPQDQSRSHGFYSAIFVRIKNYILINLNYG